MTIIVRTVQVLLHRHWLPDAAAMSSAGEGNRTEVVMEEAKGSVGLSEVHCRRQRGAVKPSAYPFFYDQAAMHLSSQLLVDR